MFVYWHALANSCTEGNIDCSPLPHHYRTGVPKAIVHVQPGNSMDDLESCRLCEWRCGADRLRGERGCAAPAGRRWRRRCVRALSRVTSSPCSGAATAASTATPTGSRSIPIPAGSTPATCLRRCWLPKPGRGLPHTGGGVFGRSGLRAATRSFTSPTSKRWRAR